MASTPKREGDLGGLARLPRGRRSGLRRLLWVGVRAGLGALVLAAPGCKKRPSVGPSDAAPPAVAELPRGDGGWFEDEEQLFRIFLPGSPNLAEEAEIRHETPTISRTAQIKEDEDELLVIWSDFSALIRPCIEVPCAAGEALLGEVLEGWIEAGLKLESRAPFEVEGCTGLRIEGRLDSRPVEARLLVCDGTLVQLVASGRWLESAPRVFGSFDWRGPLQIMQVGPVAPIGDVIGTNDDASGALDAPRGAFESSAAERHESAAD